METAELVKRAIRGLKHIGQFHYVECDKPHVLDGVLASRVSHVFGMCMADAIDLCRWAGEDPHYSEAASRREKSA